MKLGDSIVQQTDYDCNLRVAFNSTRSLVGHGYIVLSQAVQLVAYNGSSCSFLYLSLSLTYLLLPLIPVFDKNLIICAALCDLLDLLLK